MKSTTKFLLALAIVLLALTGTTNYGGMARAGKGGAFIGGMIAGHVVGGFVRRDRARTAAELNRTYAQPAPAPSPAPPAATKTSEQKLDELDDLARKGYVTKDEYKARRKAILDGS